MDQNELNICVSAVIPSHGREKNLLVYVEDELFVTAPSRIVALFGIEEGVTIAATMLLNFAVAVNLFFCYRDCLRLLAGRSRTSRQLVEKLGEKGHAQAVCQTVLDIMRLRGYLDEEAYAFAFARSHIERKLLGPFALKQKMYQKQFEKELIKETIAAVYEEFELCSLAYQAAERRFSGDRVRKEKNSNRLKQKIYLFLLGKGFDGSTAGRTTREYMRNIDMQESHFDEE